MIVQNVNIKIPVAGDMAVGLDAFTPVFHRWIREDALGEMMIDVADYRHVPQGPGIMLIGHAADYSIDHGEGVYGLLYNRKGDVPGSNADRFRAAFGCASKACALLEAEFSELKFSRDRFDVIINDRAYAPNTPETLAAFLPEFEAYLSESFGDGCRVEHVGEPRQRFRIAVTTAAPFELAGSDPH